MDAKDIRNLQEAYLEVYSDLDEANKSETYKNLTPRQRVGRRQGRDFDNVLHPADYDSQGEPVRQKVHSQKRGVKTRGSGVRESLDTYDYHQLLKFLYFEGFADSYKEAEGLLEEVTDEEFDEIVEAFKDLTPEKEKRVLNRRSELVSKVQHHHDQMRKNVDEFIRRKEGRGLIAKAKQFAVGNVGPARRAKKHIAQGKKYAQHLRNIGDALSRTQASKDAAMHHQRNQIRQKLRDLGANPDARPGFNNIRRLKREDFDLYDIILDHLLDEGFADSIENAEAIMVNMSEEWMDSIVEELLDEAPYQIYGPDPHGPSDSEPRPLGKPYKNKKRAKTRADKLDQEIGGYRHFVRKVDEDFVPLTPEKEERVKKRVGELARDIQVSGARMQELKKKPFGKFRPKVRQEKEAIVKSTRKKVNQVRSASDALIDASTSRSAKIQKRIQDLDDK